MSNLLTYKNFVRANLPSGMTSDGEYYFVNNKRFTNYVYAEWYLNYIIKFGYEAASLLDDYIINGFTPPYVSDFVNEVYIKDGVATTFDGLHTYSGDGLRTMTYSDGFKKWNPHNLMAWSEKFDAASTDWAEDNCSVAISGVTTPANIGPATKITPLATLAFDHGVNKIVSVNGNTSFSVYAKAAEYEFLAIIFNNGSLQSVCFDLINGIVANDPNGEGSSIVSVGDGWYLCTAGQTTIGNNRVGISPQPDGTVNSYTPDGVSGVYVAGAHAYRSDLGGMVNNPDTGDSYVPTTDTARYLPRRGHHIWDGTAWVRKGLLLEDDAATNLFTYSNDFTDASWAKNNTATLALDAIGPDGVANSAVTFVDSGATGTGGVFIEEDITVASSTKYTFSIYAKADQLTLLSLVHLNFIPGAPALAYFDLSSGTVGAVSVWQDTNIEDVGNGWYRCSATMTSDAVDTLGNVRVYLSEVDNSNIVDLDGTSSILIYGAQMEEGSIPTSYIPTNGTTQTRAIESLIDDAENMPAYTNSVSIQMDGVMTYADENTGETVIPWRWLEAFNVKMQASIWTDSTNTGAARFQSRTPDGFTRVAEPSNGSYSPGVNVPFNLASRHGSTFVNGAVDGTALTADLTPTALPDLSTTPFQIGQTFNGTISQVVVWPEDIGDTGIAEASS